MTLGSANEEGWTPLHAAAFAAHAAVVARLLQYGFSAASTIDFQSWDGFTALMLAAQEVHAAMIVELLSHEQCRTNVQSYAGATAMSLAKHHGHQDVA